jgi:hypothetical protein
MSVLPSDVMANLAGHVARGSDVGDERERRYDRRKAST